MAEADNVLGISGQMDISKIEETIDKLNGRLNSIGISTDQLSEKTTAAMQKIEQSTAEASIKQSQLIGVLKQVSDEYSKLIEGLPEKIRAAQVEMNDVAASMAKIRESIKNSTDSKAIAEYNSQLQVQSARFNDINARVQEMQAVYETANTTIANVANAISAANGISTANNALTATGAVAHGATAAAITLETAAHVTNADSIKKEGEAIKNTSVSQQEYAQTTKGAAAEISTLDSKIEQTTARIDELQEKLNSGNLGDEEFSRLSNTLNDLLKLRTELYNQKNELLQSLAADNGNSSSNTNDSVTQETNAVKELDAAMAQHIKDLEQGKLSEEEYKKIVEEATDALEKRKQAASSTLSEYNETVSTNIPFETKDDNGNVTNQEEIDSWKARVKSLNDEYDAQVAVIEKDKASLDALIEAHDRLSKAQQVTSETTQKSTETANSATNSTSGYAEALKKAEEDYEFAQRKLSALKSEYEEVQARWGNGYRRSDFEPQIEELENAASKAAQKVKELKEGGEIGFLTHDDEQTAKNLNAELDSLDKKLDELYQKKKEILSVGDSGLMIPNVPADALANNGITLGSDRLNNLREVNAEIKDVQEQYATASEKLSETEQKIADTRAQFASANEEMTSNNDANNTSHEPKLGESIAVLKEEISDAKGRLTEFEAEYDKLAEKGNLTQKEQLDLEALQAKIRETKKDVADMEADLREKQGQTFFGSIRNSLNDFREDVKGLGTAIKENITGAWDRLSSKVGNSGFGQRFAAEFSQIKGTVNDAASAFGNFLTGNGKVQESLSNLSKAIGGLGIPLSGALTGIKAVTKALWAMCATPIGAIITVIVLGLKAVQTWMTKSAEGQKVYTKLMAFFGSLLSTVTDMVVTFGGFLYHCFADANGPLNAFGKNLVKTFTSAGKAVFGIIGGIGTALKGIFTLDWDTFTSGLKKTWGGIVNAGNTVISAVKTTITGAVGIFGTVKDFFAGGTYYKMSSHLLAGLSTARKMSDLAGKQQDAEIAISKAKEKQAELDGKIAENKEKIYQLTGKEKLAVIEETKALERRKYDGIIDAQKKMLSYQQQRMKLHTNSLQDTAKERELNISLLRTEAQRAASTRMLTRQEEAAKRSMESQAKSAEKTAATEAKRAERQNEQTKAAQSKYSDTLYNNDQAREKAVTDLETKVADARIAAMDEGFTKTQAERKREQEKELQDLQTAEKNAIDAERKRQKAEFDARNAIRKAQGKSTLIWNDDTDFQETNDVKSIRQMYSTLQQLTVNRQVEDEKKAADQLIEAHQSYRDKLISIDKKYQEDIQAIDAAIAEAQKRGDKAQVDALERTRDKRTADYGKEKLQASFDELKNSPEYVAAFTDIDKASTETLTNLVKRFDNVKEAAASSLNPQDAKTYFDTINGLIDELIKRDPVGMAKQLTGELQQQKRELLQAQAILQAVQNGEKVPIPNQFKVEKNEDGTLKLVPEYYTLEQAQEKVAKSGQAVAHTEGEIEKASKDTLNQISSLISAFTSLGNAIGGTAGNLLNLIGDFANFTVTTVNAVKSIDQNAKGLTKTLQQLQAGLTIASAFVGLALKVSSFFKTSDDYYQKYAKRYADINNLRQAVDDYRLSVIKAHQSEKDWFGNTGLSELKEAWEQHQQITEQYYDKLNEAQEIYKNKGAGISKALVPTIMAAGVVAGVFTAGLGTAAANAISGAVGGALAANAAVAGASAAVGWIAGSAIQSGTDRISYNKGQTAAFNNLRIQTRHRSFWRGQKTEDLRQWTKEKYGEDLFDENGLVDEDLAQNIVDNYGDKLQGQTKETLEQLIKLRKEYDEYQDELKKYVSDTYSPLVDDMSDAVWSWLAEGKDALQQFKESASKTFADIGKEMIKQMLLKTVFDGFEDKLTALYDKYAQGGINDAQLAEQMGQIMGATMDAAQKNLPAVEEFAKLYSDIMSKYGFDATGNIEQSATAKGVSSITYDQANLLVNLATARNIALEQGNQVRQLMQVDVTQLKITTIQIQSDISVMRDIQEQGLTQLTRIEANTRPISEILSTIQEMYRLQKENA